MIHVTNAPGSSPQLASSDRSPLVPQFTHHSLLHQTGRQSCPSLLTTACLSRQVATRAPVYSPQLASSDRSPLLSQFTHHSLLHQTGRRSHLRHCRRRWRRCICCWRSGTGAPEGTSARCSAGARRSHPGSPPSRCRRSAVNTQYRK